MTDRELTEHAVTARADLTLAAGGHHYRLARQVTVPVDMPLLAELVERERTMVAGRRATLTLQVRNVAPRPLSTTVRCSPPRGWQADPPEASATIGPAGDRPERHLFQFTIAAPEAVRHGAVDIPLETRYEDHAESRQVDILRCEVLPALRPLVEDTVEFAPADKPPRVRHAARAAIYIDRGETARLELKNLAVAHYRDRLKWRVLDADWQELTAGKMGKNEEKELIVEADQSGAFFIELDPGLNSCTLTTSQRPFAWEAGPTRPLRVLHQNPPLWFHVPKNARSFTLTVDCQSEAEPVSVELRNPEGETAISASGALLDRRFKVEVDPASRGQLWQVHVRPTGDASFFLDGDAVPYVSDHPARVLRPIHSKATE